MTADLLARMKGACSGGRELDRLVGEATDSPMGSSGDVVGLGYERLTTSLDAAMALADRLLPDWFWQFDVEPGQSYAQGAPESWPEGLVASDRGGVYQMGATLPMAICQAVVEAVLRRD